MKENLLNQNPYSASEIEVLEGLEPVRRRPGMYIGGTDQRALHHLVAEVLDNSMDEAVAGFATRITIELREDGSVSISDNGRGIPIDPHPKFPEKSALEVILTTLHAGGKFKTGAYQTAGGLHGVGISVVNALSDLLTLEVVRDKHLYRQTYSRGLPQSALENTGPVHNRRGTTATFHPDPEIFGANCRFSPSAIYKLARSKAALFKGVEIRWSVAPSLLLEGDPTPESAVLHFPGGLTDYLEALLRGKEFLFTDAFSGEASNNYGKVEWAIKWPMEGEGFLSSYCNTIPTPQGGTHEQGFRQAFLKSVKAFGEMIGNKKALQLTAEDVMGGSTAVLSIFIKDPQFQGQTKDKLSTAEVTRFVETVVKDHLDHWLGSHRQAAETLLDFVMERLDDRLRRKASKELSRKTATRKLRLPGKLADCSLEMAEGTEVFLVEGDSAGGSAKQARERKTQAVLPLRGKVLNVANATVDKLHANQELMDLVLALGCGMGNQFDVNKLRYERVIIMTDADVDGAHIAALLITFFFQQMPKLIEKGHLYLAQPPLYRLVQGSNSVYARDDLHKEELMKSYFKSGAKIEISRFKGLGEMPARQLKDTTMAPTLRTLLRVRYGTELIPEENPAYEDIYQFVDNLMGRKPEKRFAYIQENASFVTELDV